MKYLIVTVLFVLVVGIYRALTRSGPGRNSGDSPSDSPSTGDGGSTSLADQSPRPPHSPDHHSHDSASHGDSGGGGDAGGGDGGGGSD